MPRYPPNEQQVLLCLRSLWPAKPAIRPRTPQQGRLQTLSQTRDTAPWRVRRTWSPRRHLLLSWWSSSNPPQPIASTSSPGIYLRGMDVSEEQEQLERLLTVVRKLLGDNVVGIYLFGSAVHGGLKPLSDVDVMVVATQPMSVTHKQRLVSRLLEISRKPRRLELTIVVQSDIRPWRYPPRMDFQYGDWWRAA